MTHSLPSAHARAPADKSGPSALPSASATPAGGGRTAAEELHDVLLASKISEVCARARALACVCITLNTRVSTHDESTRVRTGYY